MLCYVRLYFPFSLLVVAIRCSCVVVYVVKELIDNINQSIQSIFFIFLPTPIGCQVTRDTMACTYVCSPSTDETGFLEEISMKLM